MKLQKDAISGREQTFSIGYGIRPTCSISVTGDRNEGMYFECGSCGVCADTEEFAKGILWALYQHAYQKF